MSIAQPVEILHGGGVALACGLDGTMSSDALHGLFAGDTRVLSTYRIVLDGVALELLSRTRDGHGTAHWQYQNRAFRDGHGDVPAGSIFVKLRRRVDGAVHDDLSVTSYLTRPLRTTVTVQLDADFADLFEVKAQRLPPHLGVHCVRTVDGISFSYEREGFRRGLHVSIDGGSTPVLVGSRLVFDIELEHAQIWSRCIELVPEIDGQRLAFAGTPHDGEAHPPTPVQISCADVLERPLRRACADLRSLAHTLGHAHGRATVIAAGVPWFLTLFGRDTLMTSLMTGLLGGWTVRGALRAVGSLQAVEDDPWRDAEPGKLLHELRRGELAQRGQIPHTPYYGTHDAQALYCLALWNAWRWTGDRRLLDNHFGTACAALRWCDQYGDLDGDGLQEYRTRSRDGYYNQGWKDSGDAIVGADGEIGALPLATVELQGYLYAARLAMAELFDEQGHAADAQQQRAAAHALAALVEDRYFLADEQFYALALDGAKRPLRAISSNPGHLLWSGLPSTTRAEAVGRRLVGPDVNSGWGLRTLSTTNPAYNALSYQRGSVWPHDTALAAAGLSRYGLHEHAAVLLRGMLEAAGMFESDRLPELFCGFDRGDGPPVPYAEANVPQAWAAAAPVLATQTFLGLVPDAPRGRCFVAPWLPPWLPRLELRGIVIGDGRLDVVLAHRAGTTDVQEITGHGVDVVVEPVVAPLWGRPGDAPKEPGPPAGGDAP